jgi:hypothetical protein
MTTPTPACFNNRSPHVAGPARGVRRRFAAGPAGPGLPVHRRRLKTNEQVTALMAEIDLHDSNSIIFFGSKAQEQLTTISDSMLEGVRNKDTGPAGSALNDMVACCAASISTNWTRTRSPAFSIGCSARPSRWRRSSSSTNWCAIRSTQISERPGAPQDPTADRYHHPGSVVRRQSGLLPHPGTVHRGRRG